jgi:hypothetical protein
MRDQDQVAAAIDKVFALEEKQSQVSPSEGQSD